MSVDTDVGGLLNTGSGFLLLALAAFVAWVKPRRRANVAFAIFAASFGLAFLLTNLLESTDPNRQALVWASVAPLFVAAAALLAVALLVPEPIDPSARARLLSSALAVGAGYLAASLAIFLAFTADFTARGLYFQRNDAAEALLTVGLFAVQGALWASLFLFAMRYGRTEPGAVGGRRQYALMTVALGLYPGFVAGAGFTQGSSLLTGATGPLFFGATGILCALGLAALWLRNTARAADPRLARNVALFVLAVPLAALLYTASGAEGGFGVARTLGVLILAYAILRHQLFDIELKIKWTIRHGTLAGVFIAVFFVVNELAQEVFSERFDSPYLGVVAAGLLLFAISPIQRMSERVANAAMPHVHDPVAGDRNRQRDAYRSAVEMALADGVVSRSEERALAKLASVCRLDPEEALRIREQVEETLGPSAHPQPHPPARKGRADAGRA